MQSHGIRRYTIKFDNQRSDASPRVEPERLSEGAEAVTREMLEPRLRWYLVNHSQPGHVYYDGSNMTSANLV